MDNKEDERISRYEEMCRMLDILTNDSNCRTAFYDRCIETLSEINKSLDVIDKRLQNQNKRREI